MKKIVLTSLSAILFGTAAQAGAYIGGSLNTVSNKEYAYDGKSHKYQGGGVSFFDTLDLAVFAGYKFDNGLRVEADFADFHLHEKDVDFVDSLNLHFGLGQVRGLYDINTGGKLTPYVGAGVNSLDLNKDAFVLNGALIAGVSFALDAKVLLDLQYQLGLSYDTDFAGSDKTFADASNLIKLGVRYKF